MDRWRALRRLQVNSPDSSEPNTPASSTSEPPPPPPPDSGGRRPAENLQPQKSAPADLFPIKKKLEESLLNLPPLDPESKNDHLNVGSKPHLMKILARNGELKVLFSDKILKVGASGRMKRWFLLITDFSIYLLDPDAGILRRKIAVAAVNKLCLSNFSDHFLAIIIQNEYDCLLASTRKLEVVSALLEATKSSSSHEIDVSHSNSFTYRASAHVLKQVMFESEGTSAVKLFCSTVTSV